MEAGLNTPEVECPHIAGCQRESGKPYGMKGWNFSKKGGYTSGAILVSETELEELRQQLERAQAHLDRTQADWW